MSFIIPDVSPPQVPTAFSVNTLNLFKDLAGRAIGYAPPALPGAEADDSVGTGPFGLRIYSQLTFVGGIDRKTGATFEEVVLQDALIEVSDAAMIVATKVVGRDGTVKEFISDGDTAITIRHICANAAGSGIERRYPSELVRKINALPRTQELQIISRELHRFGVRYLVLESVNWPRLPGFTNLQPVEIKALSDKPEDID